MLFFCFQWPNDRLKLVLASLNDQKYTRFPLVFNFNVTLARPLRLVILYFVNANSCQMIGTCIFMTANEFEIWCEWAHPYKTIAKFIVHSICQKRLV